MASRSPRLQRARSAAAATLALALCFTGLSVTAGPAAPADAAPAPAFDCSVPRFFAQSESSSTVRLYTGSYDADGDSVWDPISGGQTTSLYNALAFNPVDEYLYGTRYGSGVNGQLVRIDRNGTMTALGESNPALGNTGMSTLWDSGEFDASGTYYVASGNAGTTTIHKITGLAATTGTGGTRPVRTSVTLSTSARFADITFMDGLLWAPNYNQSRTIYRIDINNVLGGGAGKVTAFTVPESVIPTNSYGSAFTLTNGNLAFIGTNGYMYQVSVANPRSASPTFELVSRVAAPDNARSNATNCSTALPSILDVEKTGPATVVVGGTITWEITVTNEGPGITSGFVLTDVLPSGLRDVQVTSTQTACQLNEAKTRATCNGGRLDVDETATVYVTATAPDTTGPITNRATVVGNEGPPSSASQDTEVVVATTVDRPTAVTDPDATSWPEFTAEGGRITRDGDRFVYTPPAGYSGLDSFSYSVDGGVVTVNIRVLPLAEPETLETTVGVPVSIPVADLVALGSGTELTLETVGSPVNGSVAIVDDDVVFTPAGGFSGTASYTYTLVDPDGLTVTETVTVVVRNVFSDGSAAEDGVVTPHRTAKSIALAELATASGAALTASGVSVESGPAHGTTNVDATTGAVTYTPTGGYAGSDSFSVELCDGNGDCTVVTIAVTVQPNTVTATGETVSTDAGEPTDPVDVRVNDVSASGQSFAAPEVVTEPLHGETSVGADGRITYTPDAGFSGVDEFAYRVCDTSTPTPVCDTAVVEVEVANVFTPGKAARDGVTTPHNTPAEIALDDIVTTDGLPIAGGGITETDAPAHGKLSFDPDTGVTYTPETGYAGTDEFELELCDANGECTTVTISVEVSRNTVAAGADTPETEYGKPVDIDVTENDTSASGQPLGDPVIVTGAAHGTAVPGDDGVIVYTPAAGFSGEDTFTYRVCDTSTPTPVCDSATVTVDVANAFTAGDAAIEGVTTPHNADVTIPLDDIVTAAGAPLDPESVTVTRDATHGEPEVDPDTGEITYTPDAGYAGTDVIEVEVCDVNGDCTSVTIVITVLENTVRATDDSVSTPAGETRVFPVTDDDESASGQELANPTIVSDPTHGTPTVDDDGQIRYVPDAGFSGEDELEYQVCDTSHPEPVCDTATVIITVTNVFVAGPALDGVATPHNTPAEIALDDIVTTLGLPVEPDEITVTDAPAHGTLSFDPDTGVTYTPETGYAGTDEFELELCDANGECTTVTIAVEVSENSVAAGADAAETDVDESVTVDVRADDTSASGQPLAFPTVARDPLHGTATVNESGLVLYTPEAGFSGEDDFEYEVCDTSHPEPVCDTATVTVTVRNVFDEGPALGVGGAEAGQDEPLPIDLDDVLTPRGAPLDPSTVLVTVDPVEGEVDYDPETGEFVYTPGDGYSGTDQFTFVVCDESVPTQCTEATVRVGVGVNVVTAVDDAVRAGYGEPVVIDVARNDTSATGRPLGAPVIVATPRHGTVEVLDDGTVRYTPREGYSGDDTFEYERCDDSRPTPVCDVATVSVTVAAAPLPMTGAAVAVPGLAAAAAVFAGLALVLLGARRRRAAG